MATIIRRASFNSDPVGFQLDALRSVVQLSPWDLSFVLKSHGNGYALFFQGSFKGGYRQGFLMAEKSQQVRVFARPETAFRLLKGMGIVSFKVDLTDPFQEEDLP